MAAAGQETPQLPAPSHSLCLAAIRPPRVSASGNSKRFKLLELLRKRPVWVLSCQSAMRQLGVVGAVTAVTQWEDENCLALMDSSRRTAYTAAGSKIDALSWASEASSNGQVDGEERKGRPAWVVTSISQPVYTVCVRGLEKERRDRQMLGSALHAHWGLCYDCEYERGLWPPSSLLLLFSGSLGIRHRYSQTTSTHT